MLNTSRNMSDTTHVTPAIVRIFIHKLPAFCMAWTGTDGTGALNTAYSFDLGKSWKSNPPLWKETSHAGPALAYQNEKLFMAWTGSNPGHNLNIMQSADGGATWSGKHILNDSSIAAPALISYMGVLIMAWTGTDGKRHLNIASSKDEGRTWTKVPVGDLSLGAPSLAQYTSGAGFSHLFLAFTGTDNHLFVKSCEGLKVEYFSHPDHNRIAETSSYGPSLAVMDSGEGKDIFLAIAWTGQDARHSLNVAYSLQGFSPFGNKEVSPHDTSNAGPSIVKNSNYPAENDQLGWVWSGSNGGHLNFAPGTALGFKA